MQTDVALILSAILAKSPEWIRKDLASKDASTRTRAEEALAALIAAGLEDSSPEPGLPA